MAKIQVNSETQTTYTDITVRGKTLTVTIDNREDGNLIYWSETDSTIQAYSCTDLNILFNDQIILTTYDAILTDNDLNVINRLTNNIQTGPEDSVAWETFYNNSGEYGVGLSQLMINEVMTDNFGVHCFKLDGTYVQPITFDTGVVDETATYFNYYSQRMLDNDPGLSNEDDILNVDGSIQLDVVDGSGPFTYTIFDVESGTSGYMQQSGSFFQNLSGADYGIKINGTNDSLGQPEVEVIALGKTEVKSPLLLELASDVISDSTGNLLIVNRVFNSTGAVEYKLDNSDWSESNTFRDVTIDDQHILDVRDSTGRTATKNCFL